MKNTPPDWYLKTIESLIKPQNDIITELGLYGKITPKTSDGLYRQLYYKNLKPISELSEQDKKKIMEQAKELFKTK